MNINQYDKFGKQIGYWETKWDVFDIYFKGYYLDDKKTGYWEIHYEEKKYAVGYYLDDKKIGLWKHFNNDTLTIQEYYT